MTHFWCPQANTKAHDRPTNPNVAQRSPTTRDNTGKFFIIVFYLFYVTNDNLDTNNTFLTPTKLNKAHQSPTRANAAPRRAIQATTNWRDAGGGGGDWEETALPTTTTSRTCTPRQLTCALHSWGKRCSTHWHHHLTSTHATSIDVHAAS